VIINAILVKKNHFYLPVKIEVLVTYFPTHGINIKIQ